MTVTCDKLQAEGLPCLVREGSMTQGRTMGSWGLRLEGIIEATSHVPPVPWCFSPPCPSPSSHTHLQGSSSVRGVSRVGL